MSAYVVEAELIDTLIAGALQVGLFNSEEATEKGRMLWRENVISVAYRYNLAECDPAELAEYNLDVESYVFPSRSPRKPEPRDVIAAIDCLDYQSCEHDSWPLSEAYALLEHLRVAFPEPIKPYVWRGTINGV